MRNIRKSGITALTAAIALSIAAVPMAFTVPSILASGEEATTLNAGAAEGLPSSPAGTLTLDTTSDLATVTWDYSNTLRQEFTGTQFCEISPTAGGSDDLLQLSGLIDSVPPRDGEAGFRGGVIGVYEFDNASQCFRVDAASTTPTEELRLKLGEALKDRFGDFLAVAATFKLVKQQSGVANITVSALRDGVEVASGFWTSPKSEKSGTVFTGSIASDTDGPFDEIRLKATAGSFSVTGPSTFDLVGMAEKYFCPDESYTDDQGGATVNYLGGGDGSCFGITLTSGAESVQFLKPLDVNTKAQFVFDHVWTLPFPDDAAFALPMTTIDFEIPGSESVDPHPMDWCPDVVYDENGALGLVTEAEAEANFDDWEPDTKQDAEGNDVPIPGAEDIQFACVGNTRTAQVIPDGDGALQVTDRIYLIGDARMRLG